MVSRARPDDRQNALADRFIFRYVLFIMTDLSRFAHVMTIQVRYDDIDTLGHVNNKSYIGYLEDSRIDYYLRFLNIDRRTLRFDTVVRRLEIQYDTPTFFGDKVKVYSRCTRIGERSMDFEQIITRRGPQEDGESAAAQSKVTIVAVDLAAGRSQAISDEVRNAIMQHEIVSPVQARRSGAATESHEAR